MSITLDSLTISDNMYLEGVEAARNIMYEQKRSIDGISSLTTKTFIGGRTLSLGSTNERGSLQGIWYQKDIDAIKALERLNAPVVLNYHGTIFTVKIVDTTDFKQLHQFEPVYPCKLYTGKLIMIEV